MGGVFGHMSHIYDNPYMTFGQIKDVMQKASAGELQGTEKTDGQNLFVSYNVQDGTVRSARNKGNIKAGGMTADELLQKFAGRGALTDAFVNAFQAFERAVESFSDQEKVELFGPNTNIYYNAEVMDPANANVINYDKKTFLIHRAGHAVYDRESGKPIDDQSGKQFSEEKAQKLQTALEREQKDLNLEDFSVQVNAIKNLEALADDSALQLALQRLDSFMSSVGVSDSDNVGQYIIKSLDQLLDNLIPNLEDQGKKLVIKRIMEDYYGVIEGEAGAKKVRGLETRQILKTINKPELNDDIKTIITKYPGYLKKFIYPLEDIIHDFAVEMLRSLKSAFILDSDEELERQRSEVDKAIKAIEDSGNEEAVEILKKQMEKLKNLEGVSSAAEGFVFDYDGHTYKFTGGFAPMNQILGLFKYGRKGIPALAEELDRAFLTEEGQKNVIAVYPGRFQPMGKHHYATYRALADQFGVENTFIVTSNKTGDKSPLSFEEKKKIMIAHGVPEDKIVMSKNPYQAVELTQNFNPATTAIVFAVGGKDMRDSPRFSNLDGMTKKGTPAYYKTYKPGEELVGLDQHGYITVAPHIEIDVPGHGEMSGTTLRQALKNASPEEFENIMGFYDQQIYDILQGKLEEISAMGAGAVVGHMQPRRRRRNEDMQNDELVNEVMDYLLGISVG